MKKWILLLIVCASIGGYLALHRDPVALEPFRTSFLTVIFTVTIFSVTFSMGGFNSSAYRQFHYGLPARLLGASIAVLFITLVPLAVLVLWTPLFVPVCLVVLPMLLIAGAFLLEVGRRETDPHTLLNRRCSVKAIRRYFNSIAPKINEKIAETKALNLSQRRDQPMHESSWHLSISPEKNDPLTSLATLGLLAIQHGDLYAFRSVVNRFLEVLELARKFNLKKVFADEYKIREEIHSSTFEALQRIMLALQRDKGTTSLARVAIDALAEFVVAKTKDHKQIEELTFSALHLMETLAKHCYESDSPNEARIPIIVARQIVQKGLDDPLVVLEGQGHTMETSEFHFRLPQLTDVIKRLGTYGIEKGDTELLYRCFDAFGWLGCSAVKHEEVDVTTACLRALSQLGREVRAKGLECFWSRCPVRPEEHAVERIDWIASWVCKIPEERRQRWIGLLEAAHSRLSGMETEIKIHVALDGKYSIQTNVSDEKHVEGFRMRAGARDVDYSDFTFLKDLELHGGRGVIMEGPLVPLSGSSTESS